MRRMTLVLFIGCQLCCCEKPKDITLPELPPVLVLHGYTGTGEAFAVSVGKIAKLANEMVTQFNIHVSPI